MGCRHSCCVSSSGSSELTSPMSVPRVIQSPNQVSRPRGRYSEYSRTNDVRCSHKVLVASSAFLSLLPEISAKMQLYADMLVSQGQALWAWGGALPGGRGFWGFRILGGSLPAQVQHPWCCHWAWAGGRYRGSP